MYHYGTMQPDGGEGKCRYEVNVMVGRYGFADV